MKGKNKKATPINRGRFHIKVNLNLVQNFFHIYER